jgi:3-polyprenyl-4-hydroxybenzoate decarboxylase
MPDKHYITLAYTGAGGTIVHRTLLKLLSGDDRVEHINVVASPNGRKVLQLEWGVENPADMIPEIAGKNVKKVRVLNDQDLTSPVTSRFLSDYGRHHSAPCCWRIVPHRIWCCNRSH